MTMMRMNVLLVFAAASALCSVQTRADPLNAPAGGRNATADARCVLVGLGMMKIRDVTAQTAGVMTTYYFLGRLDALSPKPDLEALLAEASEKMTPADVQSEGVRCGSELTEKGQELKVIGQHLVERGKLQELKERQAKP
jgi:hypothetical protein